jgi:ssDNA-binding Zn-finger/Zn-ribbon topoisomerase 1
MAEHTSTRRNCPHCGAAHRVVHIEAQSEPVEITCKSCGGPLEGRRGRFLLKYFLVDKRRRAAAKLSEAGRLHIHR